MIMIYTHNDLEAVQIEMAISTFCNARCRRCPRTNSDTGEHVDWLVPEHMPLETFKLILNSKHDGSSKLCRIQLCGEYGDPMMHPHIGEIIDHVMSYENLGLVINTNGGIRNSKWYIELAKKYGQRIYIIFGIDGLDHETNWKYREGVEFDRAYANMTGFNTNDGGAAWQFLVFSWNVHQLEDVHKHAADIDIELKIIVDLEFAKTLDDTGLDELKNRFSNLGVDDYQGI